MFANAVQTVGIGAGQMSRVDSARIAAMKAKLPLAGTVVASDAFFPFRDGLDEAARAGASAVIQPGGSVKDDEVIAAADEHGLAMVFTRRAALPALRPVAARSGLRGHPGPGETDAVEKRRMSPLDRGSLVPPLSPHTAPQLANGAVEFVQKKFGFALPYTPESLIVVDAIVDKLKETGATEQQASGLLAGLGCYVGEVFVRHARASWRHTAEMGLTRSCRFPVVVALPNVKGCDAIGKVFQRFKTGGGGESVALLFESHFGPPAGSSAEKSGGSEPAPKGD